MILSYIFYHRCHKFCTVLLIFFCSYVCQKYIVRRNSSNDKRESTEELQCTVTEGTLRLATSTDPKDTLLNLTRFLSLEKKVHPRGNSAKKSSQKL